MLRYLIVLSLVLWFVYSHPRDGHRAPNQQADESSYLAQPVPLRRTAMHREPRMVVSGDPNLHALHGAYLREFIEHEGFGNYRVLLVADKDGNVVANGPPRSVELEGETYSVRRRLIGASRHPEPRLYEPHWLSMRHLKKVKWSALDATDAEAIQMLRDGKELVASGNRLRAVGAVRARKACLECHEVEVGDLLGALRYDLERVKPLQLIPTSYAGR